MKLSFILVALLLVCVSLTAQPVSEKIKAIRQQFQKINRDSSLKIVSIDESEEFLGHATDGGGELKGYFKTDSVWKIVSIVGLSYGEITNEFYFKNNRLIFVYEIEKDFPSNDSLAAIDHEKLDMAFEGRYYFDNGSIIAKNEKGKKRFSDRGVTAKSLLADANSYAALLKAKRKR